MRLNLWLKKKKCKYLENKRKIYQTLNPLSSNIFLIFFITRSSIYLFVSFKIVSNLSFIRYRYTLLDLDNALAFSFIIIDFTLKKEEESCWNRRVIVRRWSIVGLRKIYHKSRHWMAAMIIIVITNDAFVIDNSNERLKNYGIIYHCFINSRTISISFKKQS